MEDTLGKPYLDPEATWPPATAAPPRRLVLAWGAHEREVTESRPLLTVGRGDFSSIVIKNDKVSRLHAMIKFSAVGFLLTDQSSNGTFVVDAAGTVFKVCNEMYVLAGAGSISFGIDPAVAGSHFIRYAVSP